MYVKRINTDQFHILDADDILIAEVEWHSTFIDYRVTFHQPVKSRQLSVLCDLINEADADIRAAVEEDRNAWEGRR